MIPLTCGVRRLFPHAAHIVQELTEDERLMKNFQKLETIEPNRTKHLSQTKMVSDGSTVDGELMAGTCGGLSHVKTCGHLSCETM